MSKDRKAVATTPRRSDRYRDVVGRTAGTGKRVAGGTLGMFKLYRRCPHPLCGGLSGVATRPDRGPSRKNESPRRDRQSLKSSARPPGLHEFRPATPTGTTTRGCASGPSHLYLSFCRLRPLPGKPLDLWTAILLPPVLLRPALLW